jgi:carboxypeptidase Taq
VSRFARKFAMTMEQHIADLYREYHEIMAKAADLNYAGAVLGWDQEVGMPPKGAEARGRQLSTLASEAHRMLTSDRLQFLLDELGTYFDNIGDRDSDEACNVRLSRLDMEKNKKLPAEFVEELSKLTSLSFNAWVEAREKNDYSVFAPFLDRMIALKRRQADLYGYDAHPYDALLNEYERGSTTAALDPFFSQIKEQLSGLLQRIRQADQVSDAPLRGHFPKEKQWAFSLAVLERMGFDFSAGRQDYSEHPFTTSFSPGDVRITTRLDVQNMASLLWSSIHEGGHALYEQGLPEKFYGLPLSEAAGLAVHESQSRLWENCMGRSLPFWRHFFPMLQESYPEHFADIDLESFYKACNRVSPSLIRTEADEVTYHFHVMIRYELEKALMDGSLTSADLKQAWNDRYEQYLGIRPTDDKTGILQDVHWSHGMMGYFPTYSMGSFLAVQLFEEARQQLSDFDYLTATGQFGELLAWLRKNVHGYGRRYTSTELCTRITGRVPDVATFVQYATEKYTAIYNLK